MTDHATPAPDSLPPELLARLGQFDTPPSATRWRRSCPAGAATLPIRPLGVPISVAGADPVSRATPHRHRPRPASHRATDAEDRAPATAGLVPLKSRGRAAASGGVLQNRETPGYGAFLNFFI